MKKDHAMPTTHLFMVRVWLEPLGDDQTEWRGKVSHVLSGELHYFRAWCELMDHMLNMIEAQSPDEPCQRPGRHNAD